MKTVLFRIVGTQPDGIKSLRLEVMYRVSYRCPKPEKTAAELARNYWLAHGVQMTRMEVTPYVEPSDEDIGSGVGLVYLSDESPIVFNAVNGELIWDKPAVS